MLPNYTKKADAGIKLITPRKCKCCGMLHEFIPATALSKDGVMHWFNCVCNSTLVVKIKKEETPQNTIFTNEKIKIYRIIYISKVQKSFKYKELLNFETMISEKNKKSNLTGFLLFSNEYFVGTIEGERTQLNDLFNRISKDERHSEIEIISYEHIVNRKFSLWGMSLLESSEGYKAIRKKYGNSEVFNPYFLSNKELFEMIHSTSLKYKPR